MYDTLGLHSKKEQKQAFSMADAAYNRGVDASLMANPTGLATEIGYIKAIMDLAKMEGAKELSRLVRWQYDDLVGRFIRNFPELTNE